MKTNHIIQKILQGGLLLAFASSGQAALMALEPGKADQTSSQSQSLSGSEIANIFGSSAVLENLYKAEVPGSSNDPVTEEGSFRYSYTTQFGFVNSDSATDPSSARITYNGEPDPWIQCPECYLVVKDGAQDPAQYLFDLGYETNSGIWDGRQTIEMTDFWPDQGAISHVAIWWSEQERQVPVPGTLALLGLGLLVLSFAQMRTRA